jgi:hypothetical protein
MVLAFFLLIADPCLDAMDKIKASGQIKEASFHLEWHAGELEVVEIDWLATRILALAREGMSATEAERLAFLELWGKLRAREPIAH